MVYGLGVNDADYPVSINARIGGKLKVLWRCNFYQTWAHMLDRCYSDKFQQRWPSYVGCAVAPEWHSFMGFRAWMIGQDYEGNQLDKDILIPGNKFYGPESCVFVPSHLNLFMTDHRAARGEWPIGVCLDKSVGKFMALCRNPATGKQENLGRFTDPADAHDAWRARKHEHACRYADMQTDPRIATALRTRYATPAGESK